MALTGIKIPISIQLDTSSAAADLSAFLSNLQSQVNKATAGVATGGGTSRGGSSTTIAPNIINDLSSSINKFEKAASEISKSVRQQSKGQPSGSGGLPPRQTGGGGGGIPPVPPTPPALSTFASRGRGAGQVIFDVAKYRVASSAINTVFDGFNKGVNTVTEVQNELVQLNKVLNTSQKNLDALKNAAVSTAQEFGKSTVGVLRGFKIFAQQGLPTDEVIKLGKSVALASNVSTFGEEGLSELITAGIKTFGKAEVGDTGLKLIDKFLKVEGSRAVSEADLADVFKRIGPQAQAAGIGIDELNALTTIIKERTRSESGEIGTALRFVIKNLQSEKTQRSLKEVLPNLEFLTASGDIRDPFDILNQIGDEFQGLNRRKKGRVAQEIGETRFASRTIALLEGLAAGEGEQIVELGRGAGGEAFKRNQIVMQSFQKQVEKTGAAFEGFALASGSNLVTPAITLLRTLEKVFEVVSNISQVKLFGGESGGLGSLLASGAAVGGGALGLKLLGAGGVLGGLGRGAATAARGLGPVGAGLAGGLLGGGVAGAGGATIGAIGGVVISRALASIGSLAGPLGLLLGAALGSVAEKGLRHAFETSAERLKRLGITDEIVKATETLDQVGKLKSQQKDIQGSRKDIEIAQRLGGEESQIQGVASGVINRTQSQATKDLSKQIKTLKNTLIDNQESVIQAGGVISRKNNIFFKDNNGYLTDVTKSNEALGNLLSNIEGPVRRKGAVLGVTEQLSSISERISKERKDPFSDLSRLETTLSKRGVNLTAQDRRNLSQGQKTVSELLSDDLNKISTAISTGASPEDLKTAISKLPGSTKTTLESLLQKSTGLKRNFLTNDPGLQEQLLLMQLASQQFKSLTGQASELSDNIKASVPAGEKNAAEISKAVSKAQPGDIIELIKDNKVVGAGRVGLDTLGNKIVSLVELEKKRFGEKDSSGNVNQIFSEASKDINKESFSAGAFKKLGLKELLSGELRSLIIGSLSTKTEARLQDFDISRTLVGFGAGFSKSPKDISSGASSLQELSDQMAGSFRGFRAEGTPIFDKTLQGIFRTLDDVQTGLAEELKPFVESNTPLTEKVTTQLLDQGLIIEAGGILSKAVESLGRVFKSFDASIDKLRSFRIERNIQRELPIIQTGELAKQFGDAIPQFTLGSDRDQLSAEDRAKLALPNIATGLQESQLKLGTQRELRTNIDLEEDKLLKFIKASSTEALSTLQPDQLSQLFSSLGDSAKEAETTFGALFQTPETGVEINRGEVLDRLVNIVKQSFETQRANVGQAFSGISEQARVAEVSLKTATTLSQLQMAAESAARSLSLVDKFKGFDNLNKVLGQGAFGMVGPGGGPRIFKEGSGGMKIPLDFSTKNQFEIEKDLIRRRQRGEVLFDEGGNKLSKLSRQEGDSALRDVSFRERQAKKAETLGTQRQQLQQNQQLATQFITSIDEVLANKSLTGKSRTGLSNLQQDLINISKRKETDFITPKGEINLQPFDILKDLGSKFQALIPKDISEDIFKSATEDQRASLLQMGLVNREQATKIQGEEAKSTFEPITAAQDRTTQAVQQGTAAVVSAITGKLQPGQSNSPSQQTDMDGSQLVGTGKGIFDTLKDNFQQKVAPALQNFKTAFVDSAILNGGQSITPSDPFFLEPPMKSEKNMSLIDEDYPNLFTPRPEIYSNPGFNPASTASKLATEIYTGYGDSISKQDKVLGKSDPFNLQTVDKASDRETEIYTGSGNEIFRQFNKASNKERVEELPGSIREANRVNKETITQKTITIEAEGAKSQLQKGVEEGAEKGSSRLAKALESAGDSFSSKVSGVISAFAEAIKAASSNTGGTVGGKSVDTDTVLQALTTKVSEVEANNVNRFEELNTLLQSSLVEIKSKYEEISTQVNNGSLQQDISTRVESLLSEIADVRILATKVYELATVANTTSTTLSLRLPQLESSISEASAIARSAQGLATQAWGNQR